MAYRESDKPYMSGRGVMDRTHELNRAAWDAVPLAWLSGSAAAFGTVMYLIFVVFRASYWEPLSPSGLFVATVCLVAVLIVGVMGWWPWYQAMCAIEDHKQAMEDETERRGKGWASS